MDTESKIYFTMSHRGVFIVLALLVSVLIAHTRGSESTVEDPRNRPNFSVSKLLLEKSKIKDHYPISWVAVPFKPIVDNDRLLKKYKECILAEKPIGCPRIITEIMHMVPEAVASNCGKCLPVHIARIKEVAEYICHTRRADFDEVLHIKDPKGFIRSSFEKKFGKINC